MSALPLLDLSKFRRVLCVVAHPDDMEYGGSAAVAELTKAGAEVAYVLLTAGEAGMRDRNPEEVAIVRAQEQRAACEIVGVNALRILQNPDGELTPSLELRKSIARCIREYRPDLVITMTWQLEAAWGLNHADHRAAGISVVDAIRDADNPWVFPDLVDLDDLQPWKTGGLIVLGHEPSHAIEVSEASLELAVGSLEAHTEYLESLPDHPEPRAMISGIVRQGGQAAHVPLALPVRFFAM